MKVPTAELMMRILGPVVMNDGENHVITIEPSVVMSNTRAMTKEKTLARLTARAGASRHDMVYKDEPRGRFGRRHHSGWAIIGEVKSDYFTWCPLFSATHEQWGGVSLSNNAITATSRMGFEAFWFAHGHRMQTFLPDEI